MIRRFFYIYLKYIRNIRTPAALIRFAEKRNGNDCTFSQGSRSFSLQELVFRAERWEAHFLSRDIGPGQTVAVHLKNSLEYLEIRIACFLGGQVFCALIDDFSPDEVILKLRETEGRILIHDDRLYGNLNLLGDTLPDLILRDVSSPLPDYRAGGSGRRKGGMKAEDPSAVGFTSGTTGLSKSVLWNQSVWVESFYHFMLNSASFEGKPVFLLVMPFSTVGSLNILPVMMMGAGAHILSDFDCGETARMISEKKITHLVLAPSFLYRLYRYLREHREYSMASVRSLTVGSAVFSPAQWERINPLFNGKISQSYGMAEVLAPLASRTLAPGEKAPATVGKPIPQIKVALRDKDGEGRGKISLRSTTMSRRYLGIESPAYDKGWFHTSDWGRFDDRGEWEILGRDRDRLEGNNRVFFLRELEEIFHRREDVSDVMLIPGEKVIDAFIVLQAGSETSEGSLHSFASLYFPGDFPLGKVRVIESLPLSSSGKKLPSLLTDITRV